MRGASAAAVAAAVGLAACASIPRDPRLDYAALAFPDDTAYALAASLTAEVGPRFAGTEGDARAVQWAVRKLTELGFRNVRAEPVTVPRWIRGEIAVELLGDKPRRLQALALGGSVPTPERGIVAPVLRVESVDALQALPDAAVRGRVVYFAGRMERTRDKQGYRKGAPVRRQGPVVAARKGAVATLLRSVGTDANGPPHTGRVVYEADAPKIPAAALATASAGVLDRAVAVGDARVRLVVTSQLAGEAQSANVVGEIPGRSGEIVLLGAHLDSWDTTPGANDDAAGVGIVIAAAKRVARLGHVPGRTLRVVLFANEEFGASGSHAYVQAHAGELARHVVALEADSGSAPVFQLDASVAGFDWPWVAATARELGLQAGANGIDGGIDLVELRRRGVPEVIAVQDMTQYFDLHHTAADSVDTLDRDGLSQASAIFASIAHAAAERPGPFFRLPPPQEK